MFIVISKFKLNCFFILLLLSFFLIIKAFQLENSPILLRTIYYPSLHFNFKKKIKLANIDGLIYRKVYHVYRTASRSF